MCASLTIAKDESRAQSADSSKVYRKPRAFICHHFYDKFFTI